MGAVKDAESAVICVIPHLGIASGVARWYFFKPKFQIWVNF
jgi:hypothetical protein